MKKKIIYLSLFVAAMLAINALSSGMRAWVSILLGQHGKPAFVTPGFQAMNIIGGILFILGYFLLGYYIPVKNNILRGLIYTFLFWISDYFPQVMGMIGGTSTFISADAMSVPTIAVDTVKYILTGMALGFFLIPGKVTVKKACDKYAFLKACVLSTVLFPAALGLGEVIVGFINSEMYCVNSFGIIEDTHLSFYITFYFFQAVSGLVMPLFYRYTEYNNKSSWLKFAAAFGIMLWLPIVLIVMFFGVDPIITIAWGIMMVAVVFLDTFCYTKFFKEVKN